VEQQEVPPLAGPFTDRKMEAVSTGQLHPVEARRRYRRVHVAPPGVSPIS
jgi:hypothetical protein